MPNVVFEKREKAKFLRLAFEWSEMLIADAKFCKQ